MTANVVSLHQERVESVRSERGSPDLRRHCCLTPRRMKSTEMSMSWLGHVGHRHGRILGHPRALVVASNEASRPTGPSSLSVWRFKNAVVQGN